jgi:RNA-binding protein YlmH
MDMTDDELFMKRVEELADLSYSRDIPVNTYFMDLHEQDLFMKVMNRRRTRYVLSGGFPAAERRLAVFLPSYMDEADEGIFPGVCVEAAPSSEKYAEELSHRDYLGALMSLGVDRNRLGDIMIDGKRAWFVCLAEISAYICDNLTSVRHTAVKCKECPWPEQLLAPRVEERRVSVSSERADAMVAAALRLSRNEAAELIRQEQVYRNGSLVRSVSDQLRPDDIVSVRHKGRFIYYGADGTSKKGRTLVSLGIYR